MSDFAIGILVGLALAYLIPALWFITATVLGRMFFDKGTP